MLCVGCVCCAQGKRAVQKVGNKAFSCSFSRSFSRSSIKAPPMQLNTIIPRILQVTVIYVQRLLIIMEVRFGVFDTRMQNGMQQLMSALVSPSVASIDCILPLDMSFSYGITRTMVSLAVPVVAFLLGMPWVLAARYGG